MGDTSTCDPPSLRLVGDEEEGNTWHSTKGTVDSLNIEVGCTSSGIEISDEDNGAAGEEEAPFSSVVVEDGFLDDCSIFITCAKARLPLSRVECVVVILYVLQFRCSLPKLAVGGAAAAVVVIDEASPPSVLVVVGSVGVVFDGGCCRC